MTFEEWFKAKYPSQHVFKESTLTCKSFYDGASVVWDYKQAEIDALQKRIENVLKYVGDDFEDFYEGELVKGVHEILKGDKK